MVACICADLYLRKCHQKSWSWFELKTQDESRALKFVICATETMEGNTNVRMRPCCIKEALFLFLFVLFFSCLNILVCSATFQQCRRWRDLHISLFQTQTWSNKRLIRPTFWFDELKCKKLSVTLFLAILCPSSSNFNLYVHYVSVIEHPPLAIIATSILY